MSHDPLLLVHPERRPKQRLIIIIGKIQDSTLPVGELADITREIHRSVILDGRNGNLLDPLDRKIHIQPVATFIDMPVKVYLIHLAILPRRIVHQHHIPLVEILAHKLVAE